VLAIVRAVPSTFARALSAERPDAPIDVARAQAQHAAYVRALVEIGLEIVALPADDACPDSCFIEDTCVVAGDVAVATRPGAPTRRAEVDAVAAAIARHRRVVWMTPPATLDGGDCLRLGRTLYVGRSARTNDAGIEQLRALVEPAGFAVVAVDVPAGALHLKTVCSALRDDVVLIAEGALPRDTFGGARVIEVPGREAHAANVVSVTAGTLVASDARGTMALLRAEGVRTVAVDTSELRKADGALTCLSVVL
jgi:dimethylargininase